MPYIEFTDEQKERANSVDLPAFLRQQGEQLERSGREWRLLKNRGTTVRGNGWYDHYDDRGGGPVTFVQEHYNLSYPEAITMLLNGEQGEIIASSRQKTQKERRPFALPERNETMRRVFAYLIKKRHIDSEIISFFAGEHMLYEDKDYHNAVFIGRDENGTPKHAHKRGTYSESAFRGNVESSDPRYSFRHIGGGDTLYVFEAPVDMLSFITLNKRGWQQKNYVTLGGVTEHAMLWVLSQNPHITKIRLCLDNDPAGIEAVYRLTEILNENGYADAEPLYPANKDFNEDRKAQLGYEAEPARENHKITMFHSVFDELNLSCHEIPHKEANIENIGNQVDLLNRIIRSSRYPHSQDMLKNIYSYSLILAANQMKQIGKPATMGQLADQVSSGYAPHKDKGGLRHRCDGISLLHKTIKEQARMPGIRTTSERENEIMNYVGLAQECVKALAFLRWEQECHEQTHETAVNSMTMS